MGEGRPFILPAELGGILAYFDKRRIIVNTSASFYNWSVVKGANPVRRSSAF
jgi:hypothetical protein